MPTAMPTATTDEAASQREILAQLLAGKPADRFRRVGLVEALIAFPVLAFDVDANLRARAVGGNEEAAEILDRRLSQWREEEFKADRVVCSTAHRVAIRRWMAGRVESHRDPKTGEVNCTGLVEEWDCEQAGGEVTLDGDHPAWEIAVQVAAEADTAARGKRAAG